MTIFPTPHMANCIAHDVVGRSDLNNCGCIYVCSNRREYLWKNIPWGLGLRPNLTVPPAVQSPAHSETSTEEVVCTKWICQSYRSTYGGISLAFVGKELNIFMSYSDHTISAGLAPDPPRSAYLIGFPR